MHLHHDSGGQSSSLLRLCPGSRRLPRSPASSGRSAYGRVASISRCVILLIIPSHKPLEDSKPTKLCLYSLEYRRGQNLIFQLLWHDECMPLLPCHQLSVEHQTYHQGQSSRKSTLLISPPSFPIESLRSALPLSGSMGGTSVATSQGLHSLYPVMTTELSKPRQVRSPDLHCLFNITARLEMSDG